MIEHTSRVRHLLHKLSHLLHASEVEEEQKLSSISNKSSTSSSHRRKRIIREEQSPHGMKLPPFSPTYCKNNEFPYSNFYVKLPDGKWMIKYRSGNRDNLGTDVMEGYMI